LGDVAGWRQRERRNAEALLPANVDPVSFAPVVKY
jgi:hypothetical protein